jgi:putative transposase
MCPKAEWLRWHGITADWPCHGRWQSLIADNAREFRGYFLQEVALEHGIHVAFRGVGNPNWGAHIERLMGHIARDMHALIGTSFSNPVEKGDYDSEGRAVFTLEQLEAIFLHLFVEVYHHSSHEGLGGRSPISVWRDYYAAKGGESLAYYPQVQAGQSLLLSLLPQFRRTIQQDGVSWEGNQYFDDVLTSYIRERNPERADGLWRFRYDPRDIRQIWWRDPASGVWFPIPLRDADGKGVALWELLDNQSVQRREAASTVDQTTIDSGRNAVDRIVLEGEVVSLKEHRKRRVKTKANTAEMELLESKESGAPALPPAPLPPSLAVLGWTPSEAIDAEIFSATGSFEVEPLQVRHHDSREG